MITGIVARANNNIIGNGIDIPWIGMPEFQWDMKRFIEYTSYSTVIMGYNTYKSMKRPLKNRLNLVLVDPEKKLVTPENVQDLSSLSIHKIFYVIDLPNLDTYFYFVDKNKIIDFLKKPEYTQNHFEKLQKEYIETYEKSLINDDSITKIKKFNFENIYIIGGLKTYEYCMPYIQQFFVTELNLNITGDIFFPNTLLEKFKHQKVVYNSPEKNGNIIWYYK